jgi:hypothetical protein
LVIEDIRIRELKTHLDNALELGFDQRGGAAILQKERSIFSGRSCHLHFASRIFRLSTSRYQEAFLSLVTVILPRNTRTLLEGLFRARNP